MLKDLFGKKRKFATVPSETISRGTPQADGAVEAVTKGKEVPEGLMNKCPHCGTIHYSKDLEKNLRVCKGCQFHFSMSAPERIAALLDDGVLTEEFDTDLVTANPLGFPGYLEKVEKDMEATNLKEAIMTGEGLLDGQRVIIGVMDSRFRMASMGSVVGEKITRAIEQAAERKLPFILFSASGGARMQEGVLSLMQMAKTSAALAKLDRERQLFVSVLTNPTYGGVSASFASLGDYNIAEPGAMIGFAGRRVIEQTIRQELPKDFQTAEFLLNHGQLDMVVHRKDMRSTLSKLVEMHTIREGV
ncbi:MULTISPECIES: acetyl-CoA carboxylase, carboxyltransferase subunit beta [Brevibacillus]|uniref:Acetyl-coenzyme A carboxylase carboxyl transferase subunit beta n=1 Tax=Brevibacillus borstelensis AK1 TaxID=1300222 RepID=M8E1I9_9BACL|nr:acetyl-CoA carboxylase, carboxyltransferase subunit beta [Brevibacillus borstelensis]EMT53121.1 acetyl-CoA carboxylase carboxyl transferase subunit beta [Brevibacillus borstelensis AK1]KKX55489.1 acetyl-CoA carboxylase subunit beta [Brevibacillus borstelensis cifa_chp40]MCC0564955.1 acetyl-CoA carboxylase, carboxyltransferase subunit beta [Brevibacillus borstelensis]MCM3560074.1 acetyl-CoA carboxylase, carboxyltransferase subunit beta [Brevibacillus borstelensis]MCM3589705.1 acetyl-CoA carb